MLHGAPKYSMEAGKCSTEPLNIPWSLSNDAENPLKMHGDCQMFHGAPKYSTETVK